MAPSENLHFLYSAGDGLAETAQRRAKRELNLSLCVDSRELSPGECGAIQRLNDDETGDLTALAGALGFEPRDGGTKNRCLTTWRRPIRGSG